MRLIDCHGHIDDKKYEGASQEIASSLEENGIRMFVNASSDKPSIENGLKLIANKRVFMTSGCHPHDAKTFDKEFEQMIVDSFATSPKVLAVGEIGLDYFYDFTPRDVQQKVFMRQLEMAGELQKPVVLHVRDAYQDALSIMKEGKDFLKHGVKLHCYSGRKEMVRDFEKFDSFFSFGGVVTYKNANKEEVIKAVSPQRIMLETDCPYLTPVPMRGKINYPHYVEYVYRKVADVLALTFEQMQELVENNTQEFFKMKFSDFDI